MSTPTPLTTGLLALFLASTGLAQSTGTPPVEPVTPKPKVLGVDVTFLANAGFFLESGRYSVLIDSFLHEPTDPYAGLSDEVHRQLASAQPPFDGLTMVLVSHLHPDHVQMRGLEKFLTKNSLAQLVSSPEVVTALRQAARSVEPIHRRMQPIRTTLGAMTRVVQEEMSVGFFELEHGGKANTDVKNVAHLIEMGGVKLLHVGDAEASLENFRRYDLKAKKIDVVFVPYLFFGKPTGVQVLREEIQARTVVACHVPPAEWEKLNELMKSTFPDVILFKDALEKRTFMPPETAPEVPAPTPGG